MIKHKKRNTENMGLLIAPVLSDIAQKVVAGDDPLFFMRLASALFSNKAPTAADLVALISWSEKMIKAFESGVTDPYGLDDVVYVSIKIYALYTLINTDYVSLADFEYDIARNRYDEGLGANKSIW